MPLYSFCGEQLWIAHDVLLQPVGIVNVCDAIFQKKMETIERKQTVTNTLGWSICQTVSLVFTAVLILRHIVVTQKDFFLFGRYLVNMPCSRETILSLLTETVVLCILLSDSGIESTDSWRNLIIVIFHIVTEHHYLCDIQEATVLRIDKTLFHTVCFRLYAFMVILFLYLNESQWQTVYKNRYVGTVVVAVLAATSHFCGNLECVIPIEIGRRRQIYNPFSCIQQYFIVELSAQIVILQ